LSTISKIFIHVHIRVNIYENPNIIEKIIFYRFRKI